LRSVSELSLYVLRGCPYCQRVLDALDRLGLTVALRDIASEQQFANDLIGARGRSTVPVLRIERPGEPVVWLPESRDIVRYLEEYCGPAAF
jgi:glutaredoxin